MRSSTEIRGGALWKNQKAGGCLRAKMLASVFACVGLLGVAAPQAEAASVTVTGTQDYAVGNQPSSTTSLPTATGDVSGTSVEVAASGNVCYAVFGGATTRGNTAEASVVVAGGTVGNGTSISYGTYGIGAVNGGFAVGGGNATGNAVAISDGAVISGTVRGGNAPEGNANGNTVTIRDGSFSGSIFGGYTEKGNAAGNTILTESGNYTGQQYTGHLHSGSDMVAAGYAQAGTVGGENAADANVVTIKGGTFTIPVLGGYTESGAATGNKVLIGGSAAAESHVVIDGGTVSLSGGTDTAHMGLVVGGRTDDGDATKNAVEMAGGAVAGQVIGGFGARATEENTVTLTGGQVKGRVAGAIVMDDVATDYGYSRYDYSGTAKNNAVYIQGEARVTGGGYILTADHHYSRPGIVGGAAGGDSTGNAVYITGSGSARPRVNLTGDVSGKIMGGRSERGTASGNQVVIDGAKVTVAGGYPGIEGGFTMYGNVFDNSVTIQGANTVVEGNIYGGYADNSAGTGAVSATGNTVSIHGGEITGVVAGAFASDGKDGLGTAKGNEVIITGGTVNGVIAGGLHGTRRTGTVSDNTVTLNGTPVLKDATIYGSAMRAWDSTTGIHTYTVEGAGGGNTLNVATTGVTAKNIHNFQTIKFTPIGAGDTYMLTLTEGTTNIANANIDIVLTTADAQEFVAINATDIKLLYNGNGLTLPDLSDSVKASSDGLYEYALRADSVTDTKGLLATIRRTAGNVAEVTDDAGLNGSDIAYASYSDLGDATGGKLTVSGGTVPGETYGGYSKVGKATGNEVTLKGGTLKGDIYGGYSAADGETTGNTVTLSGADVRAAVVSGGNGAAVTGNTLNVAVGGVKVKNIKNFERISFAAPKAPVNGEPLLVLTDGNDTDLKDADITLSYGENDMTAPQGDRYALVKNEGAKLVNAAKSDGTWKTGAGYEYALTLNDKENELDATAFRFSGNTAEVASGAGLTGDVYGGRATLSGNAAAQNTLTVNGAVTGNAFGGYSEKAAATKNTLTIHANVSGAAYGGYAASGNAGATADDGNTLEITGGTMKAAYGGYAAGSGSASHNTVKMTGGTITGGDAMSLFGGYSAQGDASHNTINFTDSGETDEIFGGYAAAGGAANENVVTVGGGTVTGGTYGIVGGYSAGGEATGNTVNILGGTGTVENIFGGYGATTTGNTINLGANRAIDAGAAADILDGSTLTLLQSAKLYGGSALASGNTLNVYAKNTTAANIHNFEHINFYIPEGFEASAKEDAIASGDTMLTLTGGEATDVSNAKIGAALTVSGTTDYKPDDVLFLMTNEAGITADGTSYTDLTDDALNTYALEIERHENGKSIIAKVAESGLDETAKSLTETRTATANFLNTGADMLAGAGIRNAVAAAKAESGEASGRFTPFAAMGGGSQRAETGSHADIRGWNFDLGFARTIDSGNGKLTFGPFVEYGKGNYTSTLDDNTKGFGDTRYFGGGLFARQDTEDGLWYEGSVRVGRASQDYRGVLGANHTKHAEYDADNNYYGAHIGIGKLVNKTDDADLDVYGKFFYTRQAGMHTDVNVDSVKTRFDFGATDSARLRIGTRYTKHMGEVSSLYAGLAYEYEFRGDADGTRVTAAGNAATGSPSLKGSSGMVELGWQMKPEDRSPVTLDLGLTGWVGKRRGVGAHVSVSWSF